LHKSLDLTLKNKYNMTYDEYRRINEFVLWATLTMDTDTFNYHYTISSPNTPDGIFYNHEEKVEYEQMRQREWEKNEQINKLRN